MSADPAVRLDRRDEPNPVEVFPLPKAEVVLLVLLLEPKPPNVLLVVLEAGAPKTLPPVLPKAGLLAPKALVVLLLEPKPPMDHEKKG